MKKMIALVTVIGVLLIGSALFLLLRNAIYDPPSFVAFNSDIHDVLIGQETPVTFVAVLESNNPPNEVSLVCENRIIGELPLDKERSNEYTTVYSGTATVYSDIFEVQNVFATFGNTASKPINLNFYNNLTEEDYGEAIDFNQAIIEIEKEFADSRGYVPVESYDKAVGAVAGYAGKKLSEGAILACNVDDSGVYIEFNSHIGYLYQPSVEGVLSGEADAQIFTVEPSTEQYNSLGFRGLQSAAERKINVSGITGDATSSKNNVPPLSEAEMKNAESYNGFDFTNVWAVSPSVNNGFPYLRVQQGTSPAPSATSTQGARATQGSPLRS